MNKKRIFIANDASFLNSGYGIYGKEILSRLHKSGKYEVAELGCYAGVGSPEINNIPWKFYPNAVPNNDSRIQQYNSNGLNQFGLWRFNRCLADFRPHIVFDIRDYWMFSYQEISPYRPYFHWIIMPATDSAPPRTEWLYTFSNADVVMPYTEWAKQTLKTACGNKINLFPQIANAGINPNEFYSMPNKIEHKKEYFGEDLCIIGTVMRNQKRKLLPDLILAFKKYLEYLKNTNTELYNKTFLYLHTSYPEENGWNLPALLVEYNVANKVYFTYQCKSCKGFFPSKFQQAVTICKHCGQRSACLASPINGISTENLNKVYNFFDIFVQYAICEGFGMPQIEAAACGVPIASVNYSAMTEVARNLSGYQIPVDRIFRELETNADRVYPDIDKTVEIFKDFFIDKNNEQRLLMSQEAYNRCLSQYTWDKVYSVWEQCFDSIDISAKRDWNTKQVPQPQYKDTKVPKELNNKQFIEYICNNIINEPDIIKTAVIQNLIHDSVCGIVARNNAVSVINREQLVQKLEDLLNNKIMCEQMRMDRNSIVKEDFI